MTWQLITGDCVEQMAAMAACSVDAVVCDPPYGLEFMGKAWDRLGDNGRLTHAGPRERDGSTVFGRQRVSYSGSENTKCRRCGKWTYDHPGRKCECPTPDVDRARQSRVMQDWHEAWAREALRVLKPGGHLLAFGGTRTYHRLACAVEDAGFEIRDTIAWMYGSGFPKSLDVGKAIDKRADWKLTAELAAEVRRAREATGMTLAQVGQAMLGATDGQYGTLYARGGFKFFETGSQAPSRPEWDALCRVLPIESRFMAVYEAAERERIGTNANIERARRSGGLIAFGKGSLDDAITAPATPEAEQWDGWGTALKPAHEPIVVARKPLAGTVAGNVLEHGTGALNIDGCRVGTGRIEQHGRSDSPNRSMENPNRAEEPGRAWFGRWPANVVLSHTEECVPVGTRKVKGSSHTQEPTDTGDTAAFGGGRKDGTAYGDASGTETVTAWRCDPECPVRLLDEQTGDIPPSFRAARTTDPEGATWSLGRTDQQPFGHSDSGGASRFFYCAKTSSAERNAGLDGFEEREKRDTYGDGLQGPRPHTADDYEWQRKGARNSHPTVKPIDLMRWLVRLVTPPGGTILDPFTGSGTTGCAAVLEHFDFIGIERDHDYIEIAKARIAWWAEHPEGMKLVKRLEADLERKVKIDAGQLVFDVNTTRKDAA